MYENVYRRKEIPVCLWLPRPQSHHWAAVQAGCYRSRTESREALLHAAFKLLAEGTEDWYRCFFYTLRREMEGYFNAQRTMHLAEVSTCDTEGNYDKAD